MATRIQLRRGTSAQWTAANPILASGEVGIELDTFQWKVGDGTTAWTSRPYVASGTVTLPEGGDLDDVPDGTLYKKIQAAFATAINGETFDAASVLNAGIGGVAKSVLGSAIDDIAISGIFVMYDEALGPFPGYTTVIISSVADGTSKLQVAFRQSTTLPQMAVRVMVDSTWYSWVMFDNVQAALYAGADKTTLVDADVFTILDSEASNVIKKFTWANLKAKVLAAFGVQVAALTAKSPPADADMVAIADSAASNASRKVTFTAIWAWIQSKYAAVTAKAAPVDADTIAFTDTEASNVAKKLTFANLWTWVQGKIHGAANKAAIVDADKFAIVDTEASNATKTTTWSNIKAKIWAALGALTAGGTDKATPVDADTLPLSDSEAANATKKLTFANLKVWVLSAIGKANAATGFTLAGGTTSKTFTVDVDAKTSDIPTTAGKTAADEIGAASGATTSEKVTALVPAASPTVAGKTTVGASGGAPKLTKMPDGDATPAYRVPDAWTGWAGSNATVAIASGIMRVTATGANAIGYNNNIADKALLSGKTLRVEYKTGYLTKGIEVLVNGGALVSGTLPVSANKTVGRLILPLGLTANGLMFRIPATSLAGEWFEVSNLSIDTGDYSVGSLSEEAARIANELGDTAGVGVAASGSITSNGSDPTAGKKVTIAGKVYTFVSGTPSVEGDVKIAATSIAANTLEYLKIAIAEGGITFYCYCAAAHPLVTALRTNLTMTLTARSTGELGNSITVSTDEPTYTLSGATLSGGYSDAAAKASNAVANASQGLTAKTSGVAADYELLLDSADGFKKKKVLKSNLETATQTAGKRVLYNAAKGINADGISFPATQAPSADANTLDDYEEGTCTLSIAGSSTAGSHTYSVQVGNYTKIGRRVSVDFTLAVTTKDAGMAGNVIIAGLPFAASSVTNYVAGFSMGYINGFTLSTNFTGVVGRILSGGSSILFYAIGSGQNTAALSVTRLESTPTIQGTISYNI